MTIECPETIRGTTGNLVAMYNSEPITPTWSTWSADGNIASLDSDGTLTVSASGSLTVTASYGNYQTSKTVQLIYASDVTTETVVNEDGSITTSEHTTIHN